MPERRATLSPRATVRYRTDVRAHVRNGEGAIQQVLVHDMSTNGCGLDAKLPLIPLSTVWIKLPGLPPRAARVVWSRGMAVGCKFIMPINEDALRDLADGERPTSVDRRLFKIAGDSRGATAIEYGLIAALIVIAMIGGLNLFAGSAIKMWNGVAANVSAATG
jgi:pilus assembly protein Flp/PilA